MRKLLPLLFLVFPVGSFAIPMERSQDYLAPVDDVSVMQGRATLCRSTNQPAGGAGVSFLQLGEGPCPPQPRTAEGWVKPSYETESPGIPFKNRGLE